MDIASVIFFFAYGPTPWCKKQVSILDFTSQTALQCKISLKIGMQSSL